MRIAHPVGVSRARYRAAVIMAAGAAVSLAAFADQARAQTWTATANGNFSDAANWSSNPTAPVSGTSTSLVFGPQATAAVTATLDGAWALPTPFQVNSLTFNNWGTFSIAGSPNTLQLSGTSPSFNLSAIGSAQISTPIDLAANVTVGGTGVGNLVLLGAVSGTGGITIPSLPASLTTTAAGLVYHTFSTSNTGSFTGGLTLDGGNLQAPNGGSSGMFGPATGTFTVTNNGGVIQLPGNAGTPAVGTFQVDGQLKFIGSGSMTRAATFSGSGPLVMQGTSTTGFTITTDASSSYNGSVTIDKSDLPQFNANAGAVRLSGASGAIGSTSFDIRAGGTLNLINGSAAVNSNRINDNASINLASGTLMANTTGAALNEVVGAIAGSGYSTIGMTVSSGTLPCQISAASMARSDRGTFLIRGSNLGAGATNNGLLKLAAGPALVGGGGAAGSNTMSIVPWAIGDTSGSGTGNGLVTYDATAGFRTLNTTTEYAANLTSGASTNARLTVAASPTGGGSTINALAIASGGSVGSSPDTLTVSSGVVAWTNATASSTTTIASPLAFGAAEANIFSAGGTTASPGTLTVSSSLTGSNGLTKSGHGTLALTGDNTGLTGPLTINAGYVNFNALAALPGDTTGPNSQIVVTGAGGPGQANAAGLTCNAGTTASPLDLTRDIRVNSGFFNASCAASGQALELSGTISGAGGVFIQTPDGSDVWLTGANTYTGTTYINYFGSGTVGGATHIYSDANLGNGGALDLTTKLVLEGDWTTSRMINLNATGASVDKTTIDTQSFTATLNGPLTAYNTALTSPTNGVLHKAGPGKLIFSSTCIADTYTQPIAVDGGTLIVDTTVGPSAAAVTVNAAGTLGGSGRIMRPINVLSGGTLSPGNSAGLLTQYGNLSLAGGSNFAVDINGGLAGSGYDQMAVNGTVGLAGSNLLISLTSYSPGDMYFILTNDGADSITGEFNGLANGATVLLAVQDWGYGPVPITATISYFGDSATGSTMGGNDVVLHNIVPAPGASMLLGLGGLLAARRRRR